MRAFTYYNGANAYLVGDQWYYPQQRGWVVLRNEPPELYRYRSYGGYRSVQVAPPAPRPYNYGPREYRGPEYRGPQSYPRAPYAYPRPAPPAQRVR